MAESSARKLDPAMGRPAHRRVLGPTRGDSAPVCRGRCRVVLVLALLLRVRVRVRVRIAAGPIARAGPLSSGLLALGAGLLVALSGADWSPCCTGRPSTDDATSCWLCESRRPGPGASLLGGSGER